MLCVSAGKGDVWGLAVVCVTDGCPCTHTFCSQTHSDWVHIKDGTWKPGEHLKGTKSGTSLRDARSSSEAREAAPSRPSGGCPRSHSCAHRELSACGSWAVYRGSCNCVRALRRAHSPGGVFKMTCLWRKNPCALLLVVQEELCIKGLLRGQFSNDLGLS